MNHQYRLEVRLSSISPIERCRLFPRLESHTNGHSFSERWEWFRISTENSRRVRVSYTKDYKPSNRDVNCSLMVICTIKVHDVARSTVTSDRITNPTLPYPDSLECRELMTFDWFEEGRSKQSYRTKNIMREIKGYNADVICIQEMGVHMFEDLFKPKLQKLGYTGRFKGRVRRSDGIATFYKSNRFRELAKYELEFKNLLYQFVAPAIDIAAAKSRLLKDHVALILILQNKEDTSTLCVANTHLIAQDHEEVRYHQTVALVRELEKVAEYSIPIVLCGDLNMHPGSIHHTFLTKGKCKPSQLANLKKGDTYGVLHKVKTRHTLNLKSVYSALISHSDKSQLRLMDLVNEEPLFTKFGGTSTTSCRDYIMYSASNLKVEGLLRLLDPPVPPSRIPSMQWPSDHIALMAIVSLEIPTCERNMEFHQLHLWPEIIFEDDTQVVPRVLRYIYHVRNLAKNQWRVGRRWWMCRIDEFVFGKSIVEKIFHDDLEDIGTVKAVASIIMSYMQHLHNNHHRSPHIRCVNPREVAQIGQPTYVPFTGMHGSMWIDQRAIRLESRFMNADEQTLVLIPRFSCDHGYLVVVQPRFMRAWIVNSVNMHQEQDLWILLREAFIVHGYSPDVVSTNLKLYSVVCPKQKASWECGYFVMLCIQDLLQQPVVYVVQELCSGRFPLRTRLHPDQSPELLYGSVPHDRLYTLDDIEDLCEDYSSFLFRNVIPEQDRHGVTLEDLEE